MAGGFCYYRILFLQIIIFYPLVGFALSLSDSSGVTNQTNSSGNTSIQPDRAFCEGGHFQSRELESLFDRIISELGSSEILSGRADELTENTSALAESVSGINADGLSCDAWRDTLSDLENKLNTVTGYQNAISIINEDLANAFNDYYSVDLDISNFNNRFRASLPEVACLNEYDEIYGFMLDDLTSVYIKLYENLETTQSTQNQLNSIRDNILDEIDELKGAHPCSTPTPRPTNTPAKTPSSTSTPKPSNVATPAVSASPTVAPRRSPR